MKYAFLIYSDHAEDAKRSPEETGAIMSAFGGFTREVKTRNVYVGGEPLHEANSATTVRVREGRTLITDGPFAETREQLGGFYLLDCKDLDEAIELAAKIPTAGYGSIEIRPVLALA